MTFGELQVELYARGFDYLNQDAAGRTRAKRWLNEAYLEDVCGDEGWDFLRTSTSGTAPLTISDLDTIISVRDDSNDMQLTVADTGWLADTYSDLTQTGNPEFAYLTGQTTLDLYPANTTATIEVAYFKVPTELSADGDTPLLPLRWHGLLVDLAVVRAYVDSDNLEAAQWLEQRAQRRLAKMYSAEAVRSPYPGYVQTSTWAW